MGVPVRVGIVGLGLIGGSLALALKRAGGYHITAVVRDKTAVSKLPNAGAIDQLETELGRVKDCAIVVLCLPVPSVPVMIERLAEFQTPDMVITDVASVKELILKSVNALPYPQNFVGGHPMAGKESSGFVSSEASLYDNRTWILTPDNNTSRTAVDRVKAMVKAAGAVLCEVPAQEHDRQVAVLSHMPHVLASTLMLTAGEKCRFDLAGPSWKDCTRVAASSPEMWTRISLANHNALLDAVKRFETKIGEFRQALETNDREKLLELFSTSQRIKSNEGNQ